MDAAKRFFTAALEVAEQPPERVTTDGHDAYPRAIRETLGEEVAHRCNPYLNNRIEIVPTRCATSVHPDGSGESPR